MYYAYIITLHIVAIIALSLSGKLDKGSLFRYFAYYLMAILILDCYLSNYLLDYFESTEDKKFYSSKMTNFIQIPLQFIFFSWFYFKRLENKSVWIKFGAAIYIIFLIIEGSIRGLNDDIRFFTYSYQIGSFGLMVLTLFYFYELIKSERILTFYNERFFYVSTGILLFYLISLPLHVYFDVFYNSENTLLKTLHTNLAIPLNITMYSLFAASYIWGKRD